MKKKDKVSVSVKVAGVISVAYLIWIGYCGFTHRKEK